MNAKEWTSEAGYPCHIVLVRGQHYCGYVTLPTDHPFYDVAYNQDVPDRFRDRAEAVLKGPVGKRGVVNVFIASGLGLKAGDLFDVHGSITYTRKGVWGFDCAHSGDSLEVQNLDYVTAECESLARQLKEFAS